MKKEKSENKKKSITDDNSSLNRPEWVPENAGAGFTTNVMSGIQSRHDGLHEGRLNTTFKLPKRPKLTEDDYVNGILDQNLSVVSKAITLVESNSHTHIESAQKVLKRILPHTGKSIRIGITGLPGAGKSTFIEAFGSFLCDLGLKIAVLAIDPSSTLTRGSILGDKTRMEMLSRRENAFIRPSPSGGALGGVARKTRETMLVCEAAGYDVIIVETVGIGQSETTVRSMVDFFLLVLLPGAGDELQGIKKGSVELADALAINKADGENITKAELTASQYRNAIHYIQPYTEGWEARVLTCSAIKGINIDTIWNLINEYIAFLKENDLFDKRRNQQILEWVYSIIQEELIQNFYNDAKVKSKIKEIEPKVLSGATTPTSAVSELLNTYYNK